MCFEQVIQNVLKITSYHLKNPTDEVQFVFDEQPGYHGVAYEEFEKARLNIGWALRHRVPPPMFRPTVELVPLQAADLLAHETYKEVKNLRGGRKLSGALRALVTKRPHYGDFVDARAFAALERASRLGEMHIPADELRGIGRLYDPNKPLRGDGE
jgi:hypothetical protein